MDAITEIRELSLWDTLAEAPGALVLYGTGNGADKILDELERRGIPVSGVFASDGFVRQRTFRGMPVEALSALEARLEKPLTVLLAFGSSREDVMAQIGALDARLTLRIPEVPLYGGCLFDRPYFLRHGGELETADDLLEDDESRLLLRDMIRYRLTGELRFLRRTEAPARSLCTLLDPSAVRVAVDGGAFTGDTAGQFVDVFPCLEAVLAAEPDSHSFRKLTQRAAAETRCRILPVEKLLWSTETVLPFQAAGSRGSAREGLARRADGMQRETVTVDTLCAGRKADLLKLDVEGAEAEALEGARQTIARCRPALCVSLYHRTEDLFALPLMLAPLCPDYTFHLRRAPCLPGWDLTFWAIPREMRPENTAG